MGSVGTKSFSPRNLNQDSLECFFGAIRSVGSPNPTCHAFSSAYKILILNNLVSSHSPRSNCEEDFTEGSLASFKNLFHSTKKFTTPSDKIIATDLLVTVHGLSSTESYLREQTHSYIAGFIIKKLNKDLFKNCKQCLIQICTNRQSEYHQLVAAQEYRLDQELLKYPSNTFRSTIEQILNYIGQNMSKICHHDNIYLTLTNQLSFIFNFNDTLLCQDHFELFKLKIIGIVVKKMINHYCTEVNRILHGKRKIRKTEHNPVKRLAHTWYISHSKARLAKGKFNSVP